MNDTGLHEPAPMRRQERTVEPLMNQERHQTEHAAHEEVEIHAARYLAMGFIPAFFDFGSQTLHPSCWSPALIPGFERDGYFYTRTAAAKAMAEWSLAGC